MVVSAISAGVGCILAASLVHLWLRSYYYPDIAALSGDNLIPHFAVWSAGLLLLAGPLISVSQGIVLLKAAGYKDWLGWSVAGSAGIFVSLLLFAWAAVAVGSFVAALLPGFVYGLVQWRVLRHSTVEVSLWIVVSSVGWVVAAGAGLVLVNSLLPASWSGLPCYPFESVFYVALASSIVVGIFAGFTGVVLFDPFRRRA